MAQIHALTPEGRLPSAAQEHVREMVPHPIQDIDTATDWVQAVVDEAGKVSEATDSQGRKWFVPHPDVPGLVDTRVAGMFRHIDTPLWREAVADEAGKVIRGVRADGTRYPSSSGVEPAPFDVILIVGQSNAQGAGRPLRDDEEWPSIWQYPAANKPASGQIIPAVDPMEHPGPQTQLIAHGPGLFFAREYALRHPGRRVLLVPAAYSGTAFSSPGPDTWDWTSTEGGDNLAVRAVAQTQAALAAAGPGARLAGIVWHQGEGDTTTSASEVYADKLSGLIDWLRAELAAPEVPVAIGQMGFERKAHNAASIVVDKVHIGMPAQRERVGFARTWPAMGNPGDTVHFSARGQMRLGRSLYDAWYRARYNTDDGIAPLGVENVDARRIGDTISVTWDPSWSRVTAYVVEWSTDGTTWSTAGVVQFAPLWCEATVPAQTGVTQIRVTATNSHGASTPYLTSA